MSIIFHNRVCFLVRRTPDIELLYRHRKATVAARQPDLKPMCQKYVFVPISTVGGTVFSDQCEHGKCCLRYPQFPSHFLKLHKLLVVGTIQYSPELYLMTNKLVQVRKDICEDDGE